jgi:hypothetical protein
MTDVNEFDAAVDLRGQMFRSKRQMPDAQAHDFLRGRMTAHVGTVDANGWPYVVPLVYAYEEGDLLYLHTGAHQGHFLLTYSVILESASRSLRLGHYKRASDLPAIQRLSIPV